MKTSNVKSQYGIRAEMPVKNLHVWEQGDEKRGDMLSAFASEGFMPDMFKSYITFDICHSFPVIAGPTMEGVYMGYAPAVLAKSSMSLLHQQVNLNHLIKSYNPKTTTKDRIVGCVVAVSYPEEPAGGWQIPEKKEDAPCITVTAVIFKVADGALEVLKNHQDQKQEWSVSIESTAYLHDIGLYIPQTREIYPLVELPEEYHSIITRDEKTKTVFSGKWKGVQTALAYGNTDSEIFFRGVGMTPTPAEAEAVITSVNLSRDIRRIKTDGGRELVALSASMMQNLAIGQKVTWKKSAAFEQNTGTIVNVFHEGTAKLQNAHWSLKVTPGDPVLQIRLPRGVEILKRKSGVRMVDSI